MATRSQKSSKRSLEINRTFHSLPRSNRLCRKANRSAEHCRLAYRNTSTIPLPASWLIGKHGSRLRLIWLPAALGLMNNSWLLLAKHMGRCFEKSNC
jgi:hypothetical protein